MFEKCFLTEEVLAPQTPNSFQPRAGGGGHEHLHLAAFPAPLPAPRRLLRSGRPLRALVRFEGAGRAQEQAEKRNRRAAEVREGRNRLPAQAAHVKTQKGENENEQLIFF